MPLYLSQSSEFFQGLYAVAFSPIVWPKRCKNGFWLYAFQTDFQRLASADSSHVRSTIIQLLWTPLHAMLVVGA